MRIPVLLALMGIATPALAQSEPAPAGEDVPREQLDFGLEADLRSEYLQGQSIIVRLTATNNAAETRSFPDIGQRQHLVRFTLEQANGTSRTYRASTPKRDPDLRWQVSGGKTRTVMLEVPSSTLFPAGTHQLTVEVRDDRGASWTVGPKSITMVPPTPIAGTAPFDASTTAKVGGQAVFAHRGRSLTQLYMLHTDADDPRQKLGVYWLADAEGDVDPTLSWSTPTKAWSRHVYWRDDASLRVVQLSGPGRAFAPVRVDIPYPRFELVGQGGTDLLGGLHVPIWLPKRQGPGGELRVVTIRRGRPVTTRRVVKLEDDPDEIATGVDSAGGLRLALRQGGNVDVYTVDTDPDADLPAAGKRFLRKDQVGDILAMRFGTLPESEGEGGGRALMVLERTPTEQGSGLLGRWLSMGGREIGQTSTLPLASVDTVDDVLPWGADGFTALLRDDEGQSWLASTGAPPAKLQVGLDPQLLATDDAVWLRWWSPTKLAQLARAPQPVPAQQ